MTIVRGLFDVSNNVICSRRYFALQVSVVMWPNFDKSLFVLQGGQGHPGIQVINIHFRIFTS